MFKVKSFVTNSLCGQLSMGFLIDYHKSLVMLVLEVVLLTENDVLRYGRFVTRTDVLIVSLLLLKSCTHEI